MERNAGKTTPLQKLKHTEKNNNLSPKQTHTKKKKNVNNSPACFLVLFFYFIYFLEDNLPPPKKQGCIFFLPHVCLILVRFNIPVSFSNGFVVPLFPSTFLVLLSPYMKPKYIRKWNPDIQKIQEN